MFLRHYFACLALIQLHVLSYMLTLILNLVSKISSYFKRASTHLVGRAPHSRNAASDSIACALNGEMGKPSLSHGKVLDNEMS